jgi:hypothetical protein
MRVASPLAALALAAALPLTTWAQNATTTPVGVVNVEIAAGTGAAKKTTTVSLPLLEVAAINGKNVGRVSSLTNSTISDSSANWTVGQLANQAAPKLLQITSGSANGTILLLSTTVNNTATTVTLAPTESARVNLEALGIATGENGDTYRILECDTLLSAFGDTSDGVLGGTTAAASDTVTIFVNGSPSTYFYKTNASPPGWVKNVEGFPSANNEPLHPLYGVQYQRLAASTITLSVTGEVPTTRYTAPVRNSGTTIVANYWPVSSTLQSSNLHLLPSWTSGGNATVADTVVLVTSGSASTYFHDGTNWRRNVLGFPISNNATITPGSSLIVNKRGSAPGFNANTRPLPYSLQ